MYIRKIAFGEKNSKMENFHMERLTDLNNEQIEHSHDCFQIICCKNGSITHLLNGFSTRLLRGDVFIIPPNTVHRLDSKESNIAFYNIVFKDNIFSDNEKNPDPVNLFLQNILASENIAPRLSPMYEDIFLFESAMGKMSIEFRTDRPMGENIIKSCLHTILMLIARMYVKYESDTISAHEEKKLSINHCISYIDIHYDENISLKQIAKMSAMSTTTFCNLFKKTTGMSFREYLNKKKIERAQSYLRAGEGVNETAYLCGFKEISTFYRNFVKYTGVPPSDYKNKNL